MPITLESFAESSKIVSSDLSGLESFTKMISYSASILLKVLTILSYIIGIACSSL